jgi:tRNA-modifying protein YgfZ
VRKAAHKRVRPADLAPLEPRAGSSYPRLPFEDLRKLMSTAPQPAAPHSVMRLADRSVIAIDGEDAANFLAGLVTCAVDEAGPARFGALLTPQGKIIADFFLVPRRDPDAGGDFYLDAPQAVADPLLKRLTMYRLRAKVRLAATDLAVFASTSEAEIDAQGVTSYADPRFAPMGQRLIGAAGSFGELGDAAAYEAQRIRFAMPQGGRDFAYGDAFPHEADMDQLGGVDFAKGCYVGQEVVSRIEHRGIARNRAVPIRYDGAMPENGVAVTAGERQVGTMGSAAQGLGIALIRLDRVAEAAAPLKAGGVSIHLIKPDWARFSFPDDTKAANKAANKAAQ